MQVHLCKGSATPEEQMSAHVLRRILLLGLSVLVLDSPLAAQWLHTNGPYGGALVTGFSSMGNAIFAAVANQGVFVSPDSGKSWTSVNSNLEDLRVIGVTNLNGTLYVGTYTGVSMSTDQGGHWSNVDVGLPPNTMIYSVTAVDTVLLAAALNGSTYRSTDFGAAWERVDSAAMYHALSGFVESRDTVFAGTSERGLFRSTDLGTSWARVDSAFTWGNFHAFVAKDGLLFSAASSGIYVSTDNGVSWRQSYKSMGWISSLVLVDSTLYAGRDDSSGIFVSADSGQTWSMVDLGFPSSGGFSVGLMGEHLLFGTSSGVCHSTNGGESWDLIDFRTTDVDIVCLAIDGTRLYAGTTSGVFQTTDHGQSWTAVNSGLSSYNITSLAVNSMWLLAGTDSGMFRTSTEAFKWERVNTGITHPYVRSVVALDSDFFAFVSSSDGGAAVLVSENSGESWTRSDSGLQVILPSTLTCLDESLFANSGVGCFRSTNHGKSWSPWGSGKSFNALVDEGGTIYGATYYGVYVSTDNGANWTSNISGLLDQSIRSLALSNGVVFAGTGNGVFASTNGGASWCLANKRLWRTISALVPLDGILFAGTPDAGVWWSPLSMPLTGVDEHARRAPLQFALEQNYPNPFNPTTTIGYDLPAVSHVLIEVFSVLGQKVATLVNTDQRSGRHEVVFDGRALASGVYFCRMRAGDFVDTKMLLLTK